jgi:hypothetical protein
MRDGHYSSWAQGDYPYFLPRIQEEANAVSMEISSSDD